MLVLWMLLILLIVTHEVFLSFRIARQKGRIYPYRVLSFVLLSVTYATTITSKLQVNVTIQEYYRACKPSLNQLE